VGRKTTIHGIDQEKRMANSTLPIALSIAGSDSGGGAGIQADLKTFQAFGVFGTTALTAVTAQNTLGVQAIHAIPLEIVRAQIDSVVGDLRPTGVKTGMLATAELVETVAEAMEDHELSNYVMDPVMVATSGDRLLAQDAEAALSSRLLPLCTLVTPNLHEAGIMTDREVEDLEGMRRAARALVEMGAATALVKGGHLGKGEVVDLLWDGKRETTWRRDRLESVHTHGTGCTLSAAAAACLSRGMPLLEAVNQAVGFVARAIDSAPGLGAGSGPVNHFAGTPFIPGIDLP
jgi:hydroxymethylpyrimidine/phosphomethylpyrimidine kinase